eukprot:843793-Pleurochrysis_carterae.AAC.1
MNGEPPYEFENTYAWEQELETEREEYNTYYTILGKVREILDDPVQLAKNANFTGLHGEAAYCIIGPMCAAALSPACTYLVAKSIRGYIRDGGGFMSANEAADWLKEYIPPSE